MVVKKEKQFLVFYLDDSSTVKQDLSTCQTIGKSGKVVKDLKTQLRGYTISDVIDAIEDDTYKKLLRMVYGKYDISNVGTLLDKARSYSRYEQIFSSGIDIEPHARFTEEIPRGLIKICRENNIRLNETLLEVYKYDPNIVVTAFSVECNHLDKEAIKNILLSNVYRRNPVGYFMMLVKDYNYNVKSLIKYFDYLSGYEALEINGYGGAARELLDYARMAKAMSHKYEKYPKNFLTVHKITARNYNRLKQHFDEVAFNQRYKQEYEKEIDGYKFIYPRHTQEIKDEAVQQGNCVASYIADVINGRCDIMFMRKANKEDQSLVTIEVKHNKVVQAKGRYNREVTPTEAAVITKFNAHLENVKKVSKNEK